jgi:hypothetical protein
MPSWHSYRPPAPRAAPRSLARSAAIRASRALIPLCGFARFLAESFCVLDLAEFANLISTKIRNFDFEEFPKFGKRSLDDHRAIVDDSEK